MKIELKKINISLALSEETILFNAELYVDGKRVGYAKNDGRGGCTNYNIYGGDSDEVRKEQREAIKKAEEYCKTLPPLKFPPLGKSKGFELPMNLEHFIDEIINKKVDEQENKAFQKKMNNAMKTSIVYGVRGGNEYRALPFNKKGGGKLKVEELKKSPQGRAAIENWKNHVINNFLKKGEEILNTNL